MEKFEYDELKKKALEKLKDGRKTDFTIDYSMKSADELLEINEIYQAELESQNDDLRESLIKLEQSSTEFELLFNQSPIPMLVVNKKLQIQRANQRSFEFFGSRIKNAKEKNRYLYSFLATGQVESFLNWFETQNIERPLQIKLQTANRRLKNCQLQIRQWNFEEVSYLVTIEDIHDNLKLIDMYKQLADTIPDVILRLDIEGNIQYVNLKALETFPKYNRKKKQHIFELDFFLEQSEKLVKDILENLNSIREPVSFLLHKDNNTYYLHIIPENDENEFKTYLLVMEDTTLRANKEQMFYQLFKYASDAIVLSTENNKVIFCNKKALDLFNLEKENLNLVDTKDVFNHFNTERSCDEHFRLLKEQGYDSFEASCITNDNQKKFLRISSVIVNIGHDKFQQCYIHDITDRKLLENQTVLNANVFEHTIEGIMITNLNKEVISVNKAFTSITGYSYDDVIGKKPSILSSGKQDRKFYRKMWKQIQREGSWSGEIWNKKKDGTIYPEWIAISVIYNQKKEPIQYLAVFSDFSEVKKYEEALENLAHYDTLTKLPNRLLLTEQLKFAINSAKRNHSKIAVMFLDLDKFKYINDTYGHDTGDKVLIEIANRLKSLVRESDTVARIGGDEFIIAIYNFDTKEDLEHLSNKIILSVCKPIKIDDKEHIITASLGINIYPDDGSSIEMLLRNADIAMYVAKTSGKNQCVFFNDSMTENK